MQAEGELDFAGFADVGDGRIEVAEQADAALVAEADAVADSEALGRPGEGAPAAFVDALVQVEGDLRPALAAQALAVQRGADHARVVEDEGVAGAEQVGEIAHDAVVEAHPLSPFFNGERVRVRGRSLRRSSRLPLTPTLSPQAGRGGRRPYHQQARRVARGGGLERDAVVGQVEVEEVGAHD